MIPSTLAAEVTDALKDFLATGFGSSDEATEAGIVGLSAERALPDVSETRAKKEMTVLSFGTPIPFLT